VSSFLTAHQHITGYSVPEMVDSKRTSTAHPGSPGKKGHKTAVDGCRNIQYTMPNKCYLYYH